VNRVRPGIKLVFLTPSRYQREVARKIMKVNRTKKPWSKEEIEILKKFYGKIRVEDILHLLPNRSRTAIRLKAKRLGLKSDLNILKPWFCLRKPNLSPEEWAYLAGIIDGEGSLSFFQARKGSRRFHHPMIKISNTNRDLIDWLKQRIGGRVYRRKKPRCKPCWTLTISGYTGTYNVLKGVLPHLVVKRRHAEILLQYADLARAGEPRGSKRMLKLVEEIMKLNAKGGGGN